METENPFTKSKLTKLKVKRKKKKKHTRTYKEQPCTQIQTNSNDTTETRAYIAQMSPLEKKIYEIAIEELKTSFNIEKSIGFLKWKQQQSLS